MSSCQEISCLQLHNTFFVFRIFAVHIDYGLTLMLGLALLVKYVFVDRHADLLEVKHVIELQKSMSAVEVQTQTDELIEEGRSIYPLYYDAQFR